MEFLDLLLAETDTGGKSVGSRTSSSITRKTTGSMTMISSPQTAAGQNATTTSVTTTVADGLTGEQSSAPMTEDELQRLISSFNEVGADQESPGEDVTPGDEDSESGTESTEEVEPVGDEDTNDEG